VYAVGVVGYEALTGRRAYGPDDNIGALTHAVLRGDRVPLQVVRPDVDPWLAAVVERALARDPGQRFGSAEAMSAALAAPALRPPTKVLDGPPVPLTYVPPLPPPRPMSRRKRILAAAAVLVALAVTVFAFAFDGPSSQPAAPISTSTSVPPPATSSALPPPTTSPVERPLPDEPHGNGKKDDKRKGPKH
jgi:serine/threonine-protein kinase